MLLALSLLAINSAMAAEITVIDSRTGQWLQAELRWHDQAPPKHCEGQCQLELGKHSQSIRVSAEGYRNIDSVVVTADPGPTRWLFELDPLPAHAAKHTVQTQPLLSGYLSREEDGTPIAGAEVFAPTGGLSSRSDNNGFFQLLPGSHSSVVIDRLIILADDRQLSLVHDTAFAPGRRLRLALGRGIIEQQQTAPSAARQPASDRSRPDIAALPKAGIIRRGLSTLPPPASIRVGDDCNGRDCDIVRVMSLEQYVRGGLPREWIASWPAAALHAGAIAYRSYAAWHVDNPVSAAYDICNSTSCQVWAPGGHPATDQAVANTAGLLLRHPDQSGAFRAEYSAENNSLLGDRSCANRDLSCGDGAVGSPATGWPCLVDEPVATGQSCFGHGRGMSQWGTQGWAALGFGWAWITNHYYNANGFGSDLRQAEITRPFATLGMDYNRAAVAAGSRLKLQWSTSLAATSDPLPAWFGASLRCGDQVFDDPANDQSVTIEPGEQVLQRPFRLAETPASGPCDVLVSLYADANLDARISSGDLVLVQRTEEDVLSLDAEQLFKDDFRR